MHLRRLSPAFLSPLSPLDLPQLAPFPLYPAFSPLFLLPPPPPRNHLSSSPSTLPVPRLIHRARFLSLFHESCEGNLEGLSGINLKRKRLSLLLSLALLADWVRSPGTCRLLISTTPLTARTHPCSKFLLELGSKKKKKYLLHFLRNVGPIPFLCTCERGSISFVNPLGGTNNLWRDWLLFEDVRAVRVFRWRHTEEDLWSSGSALEQPVRSCCEGRCIIHTVWGTALCVTKRKKVRGGAWERSHAEPCWRCSLLCTT